MKIVLDTNVLMAAFATQGLCHAVFEVCLDHQEIILSNKLLQELRLALEKKLKVPRDVAKKTGEYLREHASVCRIASDDHVLALAEQAAVDYIITGDEDLLILKHHKNIRIVRPRQFWEIMKNNPWKP